MHDTQYGETDNMLHVCITYQPEKKKVRLNLVSVLPPVTENPNLSKLYSNVSLF